MTDFLISNMDIVFLFYGLAFIGLGVIIFSQLRGVRHSTFRIVEVLPILAWFGVIHGGHELLVMLGFEKGEPVWLKVISVSLLAASYILLLGFGYALFNVDRKNKLGIWLPILALLLFVSFPLLAQPSSIDMWSLSSRYFLGFVGAALAAIGLWQCYRVEILPRPEIKLGAQFSAASAFFVLYAIVAGLVVPKQGFFPASIINEASFLSLFGIPVQVFRAAAAIGLSWSFWYILSIFNIEQEEQRQCSEDELRQSRDRLEEQFQIRTAELSQSEHKYRSLFENANDAIYLVDPQSQKIIDCNEKASELDGYSIEELRGKPIRELHIEEEQKMLPDKFKIILERGSDQISDLHHLRKDGRLVPIEISSRLIELEGKPVNFAIIRDLTERRRAEEAVRKKDLEIRKAYADVFSAVTNDKFLILTDEEISAALGEPCKDPYTVSSFEDLAGSRDFLRETLRQCGVDEDNLAGPISASGEAVVNAVKHGGSCEVQVYTREEVVQIRVSDHGSGIDFRDLPKATLVPGFSTEKSLGMGFTILFEICDRVLLSTGREGTTVLLESGGKEEEDAISPFLSRSIQGEEAV